MRNMRRILPILMIIYMVMTISTTTMAYSTIRTGSRGTDVKTCQMMLNAVQGSKLTVDGIYGQATKKAVIQFQKNNNLTADGIVGTKTWAALEKQYNAKKNVKVASTLKIGSGRYSPGTITQGNAYSFSGKITSNYKIEVVIVKILNSSGQVIQIKSAKPNTTSYDIKNLDNYIRFGALNPNTYYFVVEARDASKKSGKLVNNKFTVSAVNNSNIRTEYAKQIYQLYQGKKISFTYGNEHKKNKDNAYAVNNIRDTANGKAASRSNYGTAPGGTVYLDPQLLRIILDLQAKYGTLTISEIAGANHSKGSLHYEGKAVDMTVIGGKRTAALGKEVYQFLTARGYKLVPVIAGTVLEGSSHFHIAIR